MLKVTWLQIAAFCSIIVCLKSANEKHGENDHSSWETTSPFCSSKNSFRTFDKSKQYDTMLRQIKDDTFCKNSTCSQHSSCFLGSCPCHPGYGGSVAQHDANDRAEEHWKAFDYFSGLQMNTNLGRVIEVGAGPWTQVKGMLHVRPDLRIEHFTVWEPGARRYMNEVPSCSYRSGNSLVRWDGNGVHPFPVQVLSEGGELLEGLRENITGHSEVGADVAGSIGQFDAVLSVNVIEHVQDAFKYLMGLYVALKPGGRLILHERYYDDKNIVDGDEFHPIRIKRRVLDRLLAGFKIVFNNCSATYDGRPGEQGYYMIGTKL